MISNEVDSHYSNTETNERELVITIQMHLWRVLTGFINKKIINLYLDWITLLYHAANSQASKKLNHFT